MFGASELSQGKKRAAGGHGGVGGSVIVEATRSVQSLNFSSFVFNAASGLDASGISAGVSQIVCTQVAQLCRGAGAARLAVQAKARMVELARMLWCMSLVALSCLKSTKYRAAHALDCWW